MNQNKIFTFLVSLTLFACGTTKKTTLVEAEHEKTKVPRTEKAPLVKTGTKKSSIFAKKEPIKKSASSTSYRNIHNDEAISYVNKNLHCKAMADRNTCPSGGKQTWSVGLRGEEVSDCMARCETKNNQLSGPYERLVIMGRGEINFDRGKYEKNQPAGKWTRGNIICPDKKSLKKCEEKKLSESHYKSGFGLHGDQQDWTIKGTLIRKQRYENGTPIGEINEWWDDGKRRTKGKYENGQLSGKYQQWHQNGKLSLSNRYKNGQLDGNYRRFNYQGIAVSSGKYSDGVKVGKWENFYKKNSPQSIENYDTKGKPNGKFCNWIQSGELLGCFVMKNGNGKFKEYSYGSKKVSHSYTMKDGQKDGVERHFDYDGKLVSEAHWKAGQQHGMYTQWDNEGRVVSEFEYQYNEMHGKYYQRYWNGETANITQGQYCRNRQCGVWEYALQDGRYREEKYNVNGNLISEKTFSANGELESEWPSQNGNGTYQSCLKKMLSGGCCEQGPNLPSGARICPPKYP